MRVVAIDGPVGAGKSTVSRAVAARLGLDHLDTGAMYRSVALAALGHGLDPESASGEELARVAAAADIRVGERVLLDGDDVTDRLRSPEVGWAVSAVAARPEVRVELVRRQRAWAAERGGGVVEGRDIGSVVFPDAAVKVFLTASDEERARRRSSDEDAAALARRDRLDSTRAASPLARASDAVVVDSTGRSVDEVVDEIVALVPSGAPDEPVTPQAPAPPPALTSPAESAAPAPAPSLSPPPAPSPAPSVRTGVPPPAEMALYRVCRPAVLAICKAYWRVTYEGTELVPREGPFVLAPVHRSFIDFALVAMVTPRRVRFMGKESLWKVAWFGRFLSALGAFPVNRAAADREALRRCMAVVAAGEPLVLFPEGTRQSGPTVSDLYEGAAYVAIRSQVPIVPVGVGGSERALKKGQRVPRPVKAHVVVGPPIAPPPAKPSGHPSRRALRELTATLQAEVQRLFDQARAAAE
ncbi:MAG: (d)CMP kinase [Acidimicrobiales bacterium]